MKKVLAMFSVAIVLVTCFAFAVSAENRIDLTAENDTAAAGTGGWYLKHNTVTVTDTADGVKLTQEGDTADQRVIWCYPDAVAAEHRYIVYTVEEGTAPAQLGLSRNLTAAEAQELILDQSYCTPGTHVVDTLELGADLPTIGYYYFNVYAIAGRDVVISNFYMTDTLPTGNEGGAETGAESAVAVAVAAVLGAGALLMISRKK